MPDWNHSATDQRSEDRLVYFDTSAWDRLAKDCNRDQVIRSIQRKKFRVLASVISVGEVLRTPDLKQRQLTCSTMCALHGDGPVLDHPLALARAAAQAVLKGDGDFLLPESGPARSLRVCMSDPTAPPTREITGWLSNMNGNVESFIEEIKPDERDALTNYLSPEVLEREDFVRLLSQFPPVKELALTVPQIHTACQKSDIWKALRATLACMIQLSTTHAPKNKKGKKRPGGADLWQAVYLGVVELFAASDQRMLESVAGVSELLPCPRRILDTQDFLREFGTAATAPVGPTALHWRGNATWNIL